MATEQELRYQNEAYCGMLESGMYKQAADDGTDYIRYKLREAGFGRKIVPADDVGANDIDRAYWTDKPIKIYDKETDLPPAVSVGYSAQPINFYIRPSRFVVTPTMIISPKVMKNKWELRTYRYDVKQVFADNMVKDLQAEEDRALLTAVNTALIGVNTTMPGSGVAQWKSISGGFSRESVVEACGKIVQATPYNVPVETVLINNITYTDHQKWRRDEVGGDLSEKTLVQGWTQTNLLGYNWLVTIKRGLVANMTQYMFGPTKFLGKSCLFTPPTMYLEVKNIGMYMFYAAEEIGTTLAHTGAFGRATYLAV